MRLPSSLLLPVFLALGLACAVGPATPEPPATPTEMVARALELGDIVRADPDRAEAALAEAGSSAEELEALLVEIAADADMSDAYAEALGH
ncbi:MAG: hypothetical protein Q8P18_18890 [Pseudomonadota bacterium]|nr:hypothetical protein [Pseudomonadota bacterium]